MMKQELFTDYPDVLAIEDVMEMLGIGKVLAYRLLRGRHIKSVKIGRQYKIAKTHLIEYLTGKSEVQS